MLPVDLALLRRPAVEVVDRGEHRAQGQVTERLQGMHQHRVVRRLADRPVKGMVTAGVLTGVQRLCRLVGSQHFFITPANQQAVDLGGT
ncbi:hypothetical protein D3C77_728590 [compost metagenome]